MTALTKGLLTVTLTVRKLSNFLGSTCFSLVHNTLTQYSKIKSPSFGCMSLLLHLFFTLASAKSHEISNFEQLEMPNNLLAKRILFNDYSKILFTENVSKFRVLMHFRTSDFTTKLG